MMKKIRKISSSPLSLAVVMASFLCMSCNKADDFMDSDNPQGITLKNAQFSGEELFKSIYFVDGQATSLLPVLTDNIKIYDYLKTQEEIAEYKQFQDKVILYLSTTNPDFFTNFQQAMSSQDPVKIKETLLESTKLMLPFLNEAMSGTGLDYDVTVSNPDDIAELKLIFDDLQNQVENSNMASGVAVLALAVAVVAAVVFYVVAISEFAFGVADPQTGTNLFLEELSVSISKNIK